MASTSSIVIKCSALEQNIHFVKQLIGNEITISTVIKGNAYGHGVDITIPAFEKAGIHHFSVYSSAEAQEAFEYMGPQSTLMIMGFIDPNHIKWIINHHIEFYISDLDLLTLAIETARKIQTPALIHIDLETGMNRTGLTFSQLKKAIPIILKNEKHLRLKGATSHLAGAESIANDNRIKKQFSVFKKRIKLLHQSQIFPEKLHIASSAATINYPETRLDMVRVGIISYGYWPTRETFINYIHRRKDKSDCLKRAMKWTSKVVSTKIVPQGEFIGYGLSYQAPVKMTIMIVPVGYCNGYSRSLSNNGHVIVHGLRAAILGSVNMNMTICDISNIAHVEKGDEVVLIGKQGDNEISFGSFAEMNNSMNYEILARLPKNITRIGISENIAEQNS